MKELLIEDKAKRYDEAIERAKKFYNDEGCRVGMTPIDLEVIFPELKESEDVMIREALIEHFSWNTKQILNGFSNKKILAWLEKQNNADKVKQQQTIEIPFGAKDSELQEATYYIPEGYHAEINGNEVIIKKGEQKTTWKPTEKQMDKPLFTYDDILALQCCMETVKKVQEDKDLYEKLKDLHGRVYDAYQLEKQGEQKPTDKIAQKFKIGDWIVGANNVYKIISLNDELNCYIAVTPNNEEVKIPYYFDDGQGHMCSYHLWTIQDAKDGDVLVCGDNPNDHHVEVIMLFKSLRNKLSAFTHFHIFCNEFRTDNWCDCGKNAHPASKEQRSLLFQKMKEAGYEWDKDKKELKKL